MLKHVREYADVARREGAECVETFHQGKNHVRLVLHAGGSTFVLTIPCSPSDQRGGTNFRADVRRRIRAAA